jgi:hypothetical protein
VRGFYKRGSEETKEQVMSGYIKHKKVKKMDKQVRCEDNRHEKERRKYKQVTKHMRE